MCGLFQEAKDWDVVFILLHWPRRIRERDQVQPGVHHGSVPARHRPHRQEPQFAGLSAAVPGKTVWES